MLAAKARFLDHSAGGSVAWLGRAEGLKAELVAVSNEAMHHEIAEAPPPLFIMNDDPEVGLLTIPAVKAPLPRGQDRPGLFIEKELLLGDPLFVVAF